jgi:hypothetical protein
MIKKYLPMLIIGLGMLMHVDGAEIHYTNIGKVCSDVFLRNILTEQGKMEIEHIESGKANEHVILNNVTWTKDYERTDIIINHPIYGEVFIPDEYFRYIATVAHVNDVELLYILAIIQHDNLSEGINPCLNPNFGQAKLEITKRIYWIRKRHALGFDKRGVLEAYKDLRSYFFYH